MGVSPDLAVFGSTERRTTKKKWISFVIRVVVTLLLFAFLFKSLSWSTLFVTLAHAQPTIVLVGLLVGVIGTAVSAYQWQCLLQAERIVVGLVRLIKLYVVGVAFSHFLPTSMGGDVVKAYYVGRDSGNYAGSASAVVMSRVTGFFGMLLVALPVLLIWHEYFARDVVLWLMLLSLTTASMVGGTVFAATRLSKSIKGEWARYRIFASALRIGHALSLSAKRPRSLSIATLFGVLFHAVACLNYYVYAVALGMHVSLYFYFVAIPLISLIAFLPISINGFGVRESAFVYIFSTMHVVATTSLLLAFLVDGQVLFFGAIGGCIYLTLGSKEKMTAAQHSIQKHSLRSSQRFNLSAYLDSTRSMMNEHNQLDSASPEFDMSSPRPRLERLEISFPVPTPAQPTSEELSIPVPSSLAEEQGEEKPSNSVQKQEEQTTSTSQQAQEASSALPSPTSGVFPSNTRQKSQKNKYILVTASVLCLVALLGIGAFYTWSFVKALPTAVTVYNVSAQNVTQDVGGGGIVYPLHRLAISYPLTERVTAVLVNPGDQVYPNQALLRIDLSLLKIQIEQAASNVAAAQAYLDTVTAIGNPVTIAQAQQAYTIAQNKYNTIVAESSSAALHNGNLVSPIRGVVTEVDVNPGEFFTANKTLLTIMDESRVIVRTKMPLSFLDQVHLGQVATVTPSALPNLNLRGKVSAIIPQADPQTDTFEIWIEVANPGNILLPGMSAFVRIQNAKQALVVPRLAVLNPDRESLVFVVRNQHAYIQRVHIVGRTIDMFFIDKGISPSDKVVLVGLDKLQDGQQVRVTRVEGQTS